MVIVLVRAMLVFAVSMALATTAVLILALATITIVASGIVMIVALCVPADRVRWHAPAKVAVLGEWRDWQ